MCIRDRVEASRNFANKIWNASRFILMNIDGHDVPNQLPEKLALEDKWIVHQFNQVVKEVTDNLEHFEIGIAVQKLYDFLWDELCDWYIEICLLYTSGYAAPVQRVEDFLKGRASKRLGDVQPTYRPGVTPCSIACLLYTSGILSRSGARRALHPVGPVLSGVEGARI